MAIKERMSGNEAIAFAIRQINPDVMPAFPITPSTEIPQMVSTYIANGEIDTETSKKMLFTHREELKQILEKAMD